MLVVVAFRFRVEDAEALLVDLAAGFAAALALAMRPDVLVTLAGLAADLAAALAGRLLLDLFTIEVVLARLARPRVFGVACGARRRRSARFGVFVAVAGSSSIRLTAGDCLALVLLSHLATEKSWRELAAAIAACASCWISAAFSGLSNWKACMTSCCRSFRRTKQQIWNVRGMMVGGGAWWEAMQGCSVAWGH